MKKGFSWLIQNKKNTNNTTNEERHQIGSDLASYPLRRVVGPLALFVVAVLDPTVGFSSSIPTSVACLAVAELFQ